MVKLYFQEARRKSIKEKVQFSTSSNSSNLLVSTFIPLHVLGRREEREVDEIKNDQIIIINIMIDTKRKKFQFSASSNSFNLLDFPLHISRRREEREDT